MTRYLFTFCGLLLTLLLLAGCAGSSGVSRSLTFDATSNKAIVIIATSVNREQQEEVASGRNLSSFWMEYDPDTLHLVSGGKTFATTVTASAFSSEPAYLTPTVAVLEVEPAAYALVGAGFPHLMSTFVATKPGQQDDRGRGQSWHFTVDPRVHIDPTAAVNRGHYLFSVSPGEVLYIGHFEFVKWEYFDTLISINYTQDAAAARAALAAYPDIAGIMVTYDFTKPPQSVAR